MKNFLKTSHLSQAGYLYLLLIVLCLVECQKPTDNFQCPQQFGYFRDTTDCNKYYICVFGDALHDKCTPGLYFNNALRMCDWPRNVKDCEAGGLSKSASTSGHRVYGTSTSNPRYSNNNNRQHRNNNIPSPNSIAPTQGTRTGSRYTPPISVMESYAAAIRNVTVHPRPTLSHMYRPTTSRPQSTTSSRQYLYSTGPPASFKPIYYRVTSKPARFSRPTGPSSYEGDDYYGSYEDDSLEEPQLMVNQHLRSGGRTELYIRPISTPASREEKSQVRPVHAPQGPPRSVRPSVVSFNTRGDQSSRTSLEDSRPSYVRNIVRPAAPTHGSNVRARPAPSYPSRPSSSGDSSLQNLDSNRPDSLDAQFGTNPRTIRLPEGPLDAMRKAERSHSPQQQLEKPRVTSTRYADKNTYKTDDSSQSYDDYPEYYYDDEEYEDDDESAQNISPSPKVVIRLQKPPSTTSTTTTTTTRRTTPTTTRKPTTTTTKRTPTTRPTKRKLPFGISRPATKSPIKTGPKPLPRLPSRPSPVYTTPRPMVPADKCSARHCVLPDCRCAGADVPHGLPARDIPQIVLVTFDDAVNDLNYELYAELFEERRNPNGCPILGTFYVSHEWTDYGMVQSLYSKGHEMASHSITHSHGEKFSVSHWAKEINGQREILHLYGGVKLEDVRGMRAPFLQVGGNNMFEMLYQTNFTYDSSMPVLDNNPPFYPYTLDYSLGHECMIPPCPTKSFPGLWEVGMVMWNDYRGGRCSMGDACANPDNAEDVFKMLLKNFERHYKSNRAPFGLYYHAAWFVTQHYRKGYMKFIEYINSKDDVYIVTTWQALQWMRDPTPLSKIKSFKPWQCPKDPEKPGPCHHPTSCSLNYKAGGSRNLKTCQPCPSTFPWTGKTGFDEIYAL